ncbi:hypothetical protein HFO56_23540 [Rhizobium laguerreae]|uniref:hypothetical protein n=1 Tax=Rhizobium laguerreae TaxID=1076926 RepID=UPI001C90C103|nr:hypothetical protein [Rhizobium laguerreae]MBY3155300.1 hypothetical protein [Rhizobium laguerreae]
MIEVYGNTETPQAVEPGRYVLLGRNSPFTEFMTPGISLGPAMSGSVPAVIIRRLVEDEPGPELQRYSGAVADPEHVVALRWVSAACDTIAEVNALVESSLTAQALFRNAIEGIENMHRELHGQTLPDDNVDEIEQIRAFTLLNNSGDSTITWEKDNDEVMRALIEKKMAEGMAFFVIHPKALGFIPRPKSRISDVDEIMKRRSVAVKDQDFAEIIASGLAGVAERPEIDTERAEQCHDAAKIARSQSIGVMPMRGG